MATYVEAVVNTPAVEGAIIIQLVAVVAIAVEGPEVVLTGSSSSRPVSLFYLKLF